MPELPEVETLRRRIEADFAGQTIADVRVAEDRIVFPGETPRSIRAKLEGALITGCGRKGKYFWLELNRRPWPLFHLGLTGEVEFPASAPLAALKYEKFFIETDGGRVMILTDPRRFARIRLREDPSLEPPVSELGFDPLQDFPSSRELAVRLGKRKAPIKSVLLDQSLFAGVGNWMADEILYQAKVSPHRKASDLTETEVRTLRAKTLAVARKAVGVGADYRKFPRGWLFHHRWERGARARMWDGAIRHQTIGGRTSAWVPARQK